MLDYILLFIAGLFLGSFYYVVGLRLPKKDNIITGRSRCDSCLHELKWFELIPLISYIFLKGKCRYCHKKIGIIHPFMELITALLFTLGYFYLGWSYTYFIYLVLVSVALIIFVSDFNYMIILDSPLIIGSIFIIIIKYFEVGFKDMALAILNGIVMLAIMYLIKVIGDKLFKKESLGGGDIKLAFLIGLTLGYPNIGLQMSLIALIFASFLALPYAIATVYLNKKNELPYGPFLIASTIIIFTFFDKFSNLLVFFTLS